MSMSSPIKCIAFADDDIDDKEFLQRAVAERCPDVQFTMADDGHMLLEKLNSPPPPDFIILDINMPGINGHECLRVIRKEQTMKDIPVMMYSTSSNEKDVDEAFSNGANFFVIKPNSMEALNQLAEEICNGTIKSSLNTAYVKLSPSLL